MDVGHPSMEKAIRAAKNRNPRTTFQPLSRRALNRYFEITKPVEEIGQDFNHWLEIVADIHMGGLYRAYD